MLKLVLKLPDGMNADLLMTTAIALAHYKTQKHYHFKLNMAKGYLDYANVDLQSFEPESVWINNNHEYELNGDVVDVFLMETLAELQNLIPFDMYFDNRGEYDSRSPIGYDSGEIYDDAIAAIHNAGWGATA